MIMNLTTQFTFALFRFGIFSISILTRNRFHSQALIATRRIETYLRFNVTRHITVLALINVLAFTVAVVSCEARLAIAFIIKSKFTNFKLEIYKQMDLQIFTQN